MQHFITEYLISGPLVTDLHPPNLEMNQLSTEQHLRKVIGHKKMVMPTGPSHLDELSELDLPWSYHYDYKNWFVDKSDFYSTLKEVDLMAVTGISSTKAQSIDAILWTYTAVSIWLNGKLVIAFSEPSYKPMHKIPFTLCLNKGYNDLSIRIRNLGVRDTRTLFGIELPSLPYIKSGLSDDYQGLAQARQAAQWLDSLILKQSSLTSSLAAPSNATLSYEKFEEDLTLALTTPKIQAIGGQTVMNLSNDHPNPVVSIQLGSSTLSRRFERIELIQAHHTGIQDLASNEDYLLSRIAEIDRVNRDNTFGFSIANILARKHLDKSTDQDQTLFLETLNQIEARLDCADFLLCGLFRYLNNYPIDKATALRVKDVLLNFRYWMDNDDSDAMCFWSENHALLFYSAAMFAGTMYKDDHFPLAKKSGRDLAAFGRRMVVEWLDDVLDLGYEEFLGSIYMNITFIALLNLMDYGDEEISSKAKTAADRMMEMMAIHTFKGSVMAPTGRVYRDVLYPFQQGGQAMMNLLNPKTPYVFAEGWLSFYATSAYDLPLDYVHLMNRPCHLSYTSANARIEVNKQADYMLTSVQSPRVDACYSRWQNLTHVKGTDESTHAYTKSLNECFHGTTCIAPGFFGYQQHLWYGALDPSTMVFVNHPGAASDNSALRPGYWNGNGVMPAIIQKKDMILSIYEIPDCHPIKFCHAFWPQLRFDQWSWTDSWLFGEKDGGYIALWASETPSPWNDQLFDCEFRYYGTLTAFVCICASSMAHKSFEDFKGHCMNRRPQFDRTKKRLQVDGLSLSHIRQTDTSQYL